MPRQILGTSKLSHKFQITMPKEVRDRFNLDAGNIVVFIEEDGKVCVVKSTEV